jgi:hypothetical protein
LRGGHFESDVEVPLKKMREAKKKKKKHWKKSYITPSIYMESKPFPKQLENIHIFFFSFYFIRG